MGGIGIYSLHQTAATMDRSISRGSDVRDDVRQVQIATLKTRIKEADHVAGRDCALVDSVAADMGEVTRNIKLIEAALPAGNPQQATLDRINGLAADYLKGFLAVAEVYKARGDQAQGRHGEFRAKAREVEGRMERRRG